MNNDYVIWCTYHNKNIPKEYNLYDSKNFKLYYNDARNLECDNINYLHDYLGDMSTYYYVWKNNIKSDIVGFCQYRRHFTNIDFNQINKIGYEAYRGGFFPETFYKNIGNVMNSYFINCYVNYLKLKYNINILPLMSKHNIYASWHSMYLYKWDVFCDACDFMFGFLEYLLPNERWKISSNLIHLCKLNNLNNEYDYETITKIYSEMPYYHRLYSCINEFILGIYLSLKYGCGGNNEDKYVLICEEKINNFDILDKWYKNNIKSGIVNILVYSDNLEVSDNWDDRLNCRTYEYLKIFKTREELFNYINYTNLIPIFIKSSERIHCDNSIDFHNGNYDIEKIK